MTNCPDCGKTPSRFCRNGIPHHDYRTCGNCGRTWDDGKVTSMTPAPSARCPFEYFHDGTPVPDDWPVQPVRGDLVEVARGVWVREDRAETWRHERAGK